MAYTIFEVLYPHTQKDLTRIIAAVESVKIEPPAEDVATEKMTEKASKKASKPRKTTKSKKG